MTGLGNLRGFFFNINDSMSACDQINKLSAA